MAATHKRELKLRGERSYREAAITILKTRAANVAEGTPVAAKADRPYRIAVSSEKPMLLWDYYGDPYYEILGHNEGEADLSRFYAGASLRHTHYGDQVGSVSDPTLEDGRCFVDAGFLSVGKGAEYEVGVKEGHIQNVSLGYTPVGQPMSAGFSSDGIPMYRFAWIAFHVAMEPDPEEFKRVGFGRSADNTGTTERVFTVQTTGDRPKEERAMKFKPRMDGQPDDRTRTAAAGGVTEPPEGGDPNAAEATRTAAAAAGRAAPVVDVIAERGRAVADERERVLAIEDIAGAHDIDRATVQDWLYGESPLSYRQACGKIREMKASQGNAQPTAERLNGGGSGRSLVNVPKKDLKHWSLCRAMGAAAGVMKLDGLEKEISDETNRLAGTRAVRHEGGVWIPLRLSNLRPEMVERVRSVDSIRGRAMGSMVAGGGAETVFETRGDIIEKIVARNILLGAGASLSTDLTEPMVILKEEEDVDGYWTSENPPAPVADTQLHWSTVTLNPRTLMATMPWSRQFEKITSIDVEVRGENRMANRLSRMLDNGGLRGSGTGGEVLGLFNTPGVLTPDSAPWTGVPTKANLEEMIGTVADSEGDEVPGAQGFIMTTKLFHAFRAKPLESGMPIYMATGDRFNGKLVDFPARGSNQVKKTGDTKHPLAFGTWSEIEFGTFGAIEAILDTVTLARWGQRRLTLFWMADCVNRHPESFCVTEAEAA